jgi:hypothetical protein
MSFSFKLGSFNEVLSVRDRVPRPIAQVNIAPTPPGFQALVFYLSASSPEQGRSRKMLELHALPICPYLCAAFVIFSDS